MKASFSRVNKENKEKLIADFSKNKKFNPIDINIYTLNQKETLNSVSTLNELRKILDMPSDSSIPAFSPPISQSTEPFPEKMEDRLRVFRIQDIKKDSLLGPKIPDKEFKSLVTEAMATLNEKDFLKEFLPTKIKTGDHKGTKFPLEELKDLYSIVHQNHV